MAGGESETEKKDPEPAVINFEVPSWAGKPPTGFHLDVMKGDKLIQKLMIDEKKCYYFGRNPQMCDFAIDHTSCSRVHAALLYHRQLARCFLVDLGSTHGTFIGKVRLEAQKPQHLMVDQLFHFGASTRKYVLREKPAGPSFGGKGLSEATAIKGSKGAQLLGLPEVEEDLDNLTEYNTALNRRIAAMGLPESDNKYRKSNSGSVHFDDDEHIINPEDVDPSVGRFRNLVHTAVIPNKKSRFDESALVELDKLSASSHDTGERHGGSHPSSSRSSSGSHLSGFGPISAQLGLSLPNSAPDVDLYAPTLPPPIFDGGKVAIGGVNQGPAVTPLEEGPKKKKYAKEAWPGKKPGTHLLV